MNEAEFEAVLKQCSLHALLILSSRALTRAGFGDVQLLDRRQSRQKSRHGGHELVCETTVGGLPFRAIVKVVEESVRLRNVDELAGAVRRMHADLGIVISPSKLTKNAAKHLHAYAPIRLESYTDRTFADLLSRYHIGVRSRGEVDYAFFTSLEDASDRLLSFLKLHNL